MKVNDVYNNLSLLCLPKVLKCSLPYLFSVMKSLLYFAIIVNVATSVLHILCNLSLWLYVAVTLESGYLKAGKIVAKCIFNFYMFNS